MTGTVGPGSLESLSLGVAIPAAGKGVRMGGRPKAFIELAGVPLLRYSLRTFLDISQVHRVVVALGRTDAADPPVWLTELDPRIRIVEGGATRSASVRAALEALETSVEVAVVHDAARPFVTEEIVRRCVSEVGSGVGAISGWPSVDTLKEVDAERCVVDTPERSRFWRAQTPQAFSRSELLRAYRRAARESFEATDDAAIFTWAGGEVRMVEGSPWNLKVTHAQDLRIAEAILGARRGSTVGP